MIMAMINYLSSKSELVWALTSWHDNDDRAITKMPIDLTSCGQKVPRNCSLHASPHCSTLTDFPPLAHDCRTARPAEIPAGPCQRIYSTSGGGGKLKSLHNGSFLLLGGNIMRQWELRGLQFVVFLQMTSKIVSIREDRSGLGRHWTRPDASCQGCMTRPRQARPWPGQAPTGQAWPWQAMTGQAWPWQA